jgi:hypothetical protein
LRSENLYVQNAGFAIEVKMAPTPREGVNEEPYTSAAAGVLHGVKAKIERSMSQISRQKS